ncbi:MAG: class I adenylate cyclase [Candidatus Hydrogenedentota bacterium]
MYKILIVDDIAQTHLLYKQSLSDIGEIDFIDAHSGEDALRKTFLFKPNLIFLDIGLPDLSGIEVLKKIREFNKEIAVILISAYPMDDYYGLKDSLNILEYIKKPVKINYLKERINYIMRNRGIGTEDKDYFEIFNKNLGAYLRYNNIKKYRIYNFYQIDKSFLVSYLHLLISLNQKNLPGYVKGLTDIGIENYEYTNEDISFIKNFSETGIPDITDKGIKGIYFMGSAGSVAQTPYSDLDVWVIVDEEYLEIVRLKTEHLKEILRQKHNLEINCFVMKERDVREAVFGLMDSESSGSAQGYLLKEEFYRTMTFIAGKIPFWCIIPSNYTDDEYRYWFNNLSLAKFIDLGNILELPKSEFVGASLWQILKGLSSPFKSVLKIALLLNYFENPGESMPLCNVLKNNIFNSITEPGLTDPYFLITTVVRKYATDKKNEELKELIDRCFLLKVFQNRTIDEYRTHIIKKYIEDWKVQRTIVYETRNFGNWSYTKLKDFEIRVSNFMLKTLDNFLKKQKEINIKKDDLNSIINIFEMYYREEKNRILPINELKKYSFNGTNYTLYLTSENKWELHQGIKTESLLKKDKSTCLGRFVSIIDLCAYLVYNDLYNDSWKIKVISFEEKALLDEMKMVVSELEKYRVKHSLTIEPTPKEKVLNQVILLTNIYDPAAVEEISITAINKWRLKGLYIERMFSLEDGYRYFIKILENINNTTLNFVIGSDVKHENIEFFNALKRGIDFFRENAEDDRIYYFREDEQIVAIHRVGGRYSLKYLDSFEEFEKYKGDRICKRA